jgi:hypothetical protein
MQQKRKKLICCLKRKKYCSPLITGYAAGECPTGRAGEELTMLNVKYTEDVWTIFTGGRRKKFIWKYENTVFEIRHLI